MRRGFTVVQPQAYRKNQTITPENAALVQARLERLNKLKTDLEAIAPRSTPTKEQTTALYQDLLAVVDGSSRPTPAVVQQLAADLASMMSRLGKSGSIDTIKLVQSLKVVMNSAYLSPVNVHAATLASLDVLNTSGIADGDSQAIARDLKAISTEAAALGRPGMIR
jgi:hypothetical protein